MGSASRSVVGREAKLGRSSQPVAHLLHRRAQVLHQRRHLRMQRLHALQLPVPCSPRMQLLHGDSYFTLHLHTSNIRLISLHIASQTPSLSLGMWLRFLIDSCRFCVLILCSSREAQEAASYIFLVLNCFASSDPVASLHAQSRLPPLSGQCFWTLSMWSKQLGVRSTILGLLAPQNHEETCAVASARWPTTDRRCSAH